MSVATLAALEAAILAHYRDTSEDVSSSTVLNAWVLGVETSRLIETEGGAVIGFDNSYFASDSSPNLTAHLAQWASDEIGALLIGEGTVAHQGEDE